jgi:hypothetical protein
MAASLPLPAPPFQQSRFLNLPAEIRVSIYEFIFLDSWVQIETEKGVREYGWSWRNIRRVVHCARHQILLSCQHCYREARGIWYASTIWDFNSLTVRPFLDAANVQSYLSHIKYVNLRDVHDLTQLWPALLPSLRYVVASVGPTPFRGRHRKSLADMDVEETVRIVKSYLFREKKVTTRICDYLSHEGVGQKYPRKSTFCLHFCININNLRPNAQKSDSRKPRRPTTWGFLVDLDTDTVEKFLVTPVPRQIPGSQVS